MTCERHLVIMAKMAVMGRVKTRLARAIGQAEALRVYRTLLSASVRNLGRDRRWRTWIAVSPDPGSAGANWPGTVCPIGQGGGSLGVRMQRLFDRLPPGPVVIVGSDIPGIPPQDIAAAFKALGDHDAVFGPAPDGGYWLVGQKRTPRVLDLFANVRWSSEHALADTRRNLAGCNAALVREIADVDEAADYLAWRRGT